MSEDEKGTIVFSENFTTGRVIVTVGDNIQIMAVANKHTIKLVISAPKSLKIRNHSKLAKELKKRDKG